MPNQIVAIAPYWLEEVGTWVFDDLDENFPDWGPSPYYSVTLSKTATLSDLLAHLYVLVPVFDKTAAPRRPRSVTCSRTFTSWSPSSTKRPPLVPLFPPLASLVPGQLPCRRHGTPLAGLNRPVL